MPTFSREVEQSLHRALALANERRHEYATLEHLLLGLVDDPDAAAVMRACSVEREEIRRSLIAFIDSELENLVYKGVEEFEGSKPTAGFQRVVQRAVTKVQNMKREDVTGAHLLGAIFDEQGSHAIELLKEQGMTKDNVENFVFYGISIAQDAGPAQRNPLLPPAEVIPSQLETSILFTSAERGPLGLKPDAFVAVPDVEQTELYSRLRRQLEDVIKQTPSQEIGRLAERINDFLAQPAKWADVELKKVLWLCGNALRNALSQHDAVKDDPDPHYCKLAPSVAEAIRRPIETWNVVVLGDPILRYLDAQRLGPRERRPTHEQLEKAEPILRAASDDRGITTPQAAAVIEASIAAASAPADNIHTQQAQVLARGMAQNLINQILRGALRTAQDLTNPESDEAKAFAKEYKAGIYKKFGEMTLLGAGGLVYFYGIYFLEFVVTQGPWLKSYLAHTFESPALVGIVDAIRYARDKLFESEN